MFDLVTEIKLRERMFRSGGCAQWAANHKEKAQRFCPTFESVQKSIYDSNRITKEAKMFEDKINEDIKAVCKKRN